jgi:hypothetical protein
LNAKTEQDELLAADMGVLKPCPFCGSKFLMGQEPHDNHPVQSKFYIFHDYGPLGSGARNCCVEVNRHFDTADDAISAWNTRHDCLSAPPEKAKEAGDSKDIIAQIVSYAEAIAFQAGVGSSETAGQIVSYLADRPELLPSFLAGTLSAIDTGLLDYHAGRLSWHGMDGKIYYPDPARVRPAPPALAAASSSIPAKGE